MLNSFFGVKDESDLYLPRGRSLHKISRTSSYQVQQQQEPRQQIQSHDRREIPIDNVVARQSNDEAEWQSDEGEEEDNDDDFDRRSSQDDDDDDDEDEDEDGIEENAPLLPISSTDLVNLDNRKSLHSQYSLEIIMKVC